MSVLISNFDHFKDWNLVVVVRNVEIRALRATRKIFKKVVTISKKLRQLIASSPP